MLRPGHVIVICAFALLMLGVVMVNSAGMTAGAKVPVTIQSILLSRTSIYMALAMLALTLAATLPIFRLMPGVWGGKGSLALDVQPEQRVSLPFLRNLLGSRDAGGWSLWPLWATVAVLLMTMATVYVPGLSREKNGSHRWLNLRLPAIGDLSVQPSEIAKWLVIALIAWYTWKLGTGIRRFWTGLVPGLVAVGAISGFVVIEDLGTGVLIALVASVVLLVGGARWWQFVMFIPPAAAAFAYAVKANPYRLKRITSFLDPYADSMGAGYHQIQSMLAVQNGRVWGRGLGFSLSKFGYLPEDTTDFIFGIICEELGLPGAGLVLALYIALIWAGYLIVIKQRHKVLALIGVGIVTTIGVQAIINLAVVTGLAPTKGIALPLLSSGGTGWILTAACLGVLVNMDRFATRQALTARLAAFNAQAQRDINHLPPTEASAQQSGPSQRPAPKATAPAEGPGDVPSVRLAPHAAELQPG